MNREPAPENCGLPDFLPSSWRKTWVFGLFLLIATLIAYAPALPAGFVWDDEDYVTNDPLLTAPDGLQKIWFSLDSPSQYFPLTYTTFYIEHKLWGFNPAGYHLLNILLHAADAFLLWRVLTTLRVPGSWLAAAIFALHPVEVESVAWISERKNVLMGFFYMLTLLAWMRFTDPNRKRPWPYYFLSIILFALALCAKTTACTLPFVLLLILWLEKMPIGWRRVLQVAPFAALSVGMGLITVYWEGHHQGPRPKAFDIGILERVLIASRALWFYAGKALWPVNLTVNYPRWDISPSSPIAYAWLLLTATAAALVWRIRHRTGRGLEAGLLFFAITLGPLLGFFMLYTFVYSFVADHYQYLASIGIYALIAAGLETWLGRMARGNLFLRPAIYGVLLLTLGCLTWNHSGIFASEKTLWTETLKANPKSWSAEASLGTEAYREGQIDDAIAHFQKALAINSDAAQVHYNLGLCFAQTGRLDDAIAQYRMEIASTPQFGMVHNSLGFALGRKGLSSEAIAEYNKALALEPGNADALNNLGDELLKKGETDESIADLQKAIQIEPRLAGAQNSLGVALVKKGRVAEAIAQFQKALELDSNNFQALNNLAWLLATAADPKLRDGAQALALAQQAAQQTGNNPAILETLAAAQAETGDFKDAIITAQDALDIAVKQNNNALADKLKAELKLYQANTPARDSASHWNW